MNTKTDHSLTLLSAVILVGVIVALVSPTRANLSAPVALTEIAAPALPMGQ